MRTQLFFTFTSLTLIACGGGSDTTPDAGKDVGFNKPKLTLKANMEVSSNNWTEIGPADLSCLDTPSSDVATATQVTLSTTVDDFQNGTAVPGATVVAFAGIDYMHPFDTQTADGSGKVSVNIPQGTKRYGFKMTADSAMPTFLLNQYVDPAKVMNMATTDPSKIQTVSMSTATLLPALIGEQRTLGTGVIAGALRDCQHHEMSNFVATVSSTPTTATPIAGAEAYYFSDSVGLPVHHDAKNNTGEAASKDGLFMVIQLPSAPMAYVQMWGFPTDADLASGNMKLVAELQVPVLADTVITGSYEPARQ